MNGCSTTHTKISGWKNQQGCKEGLSFLSGMVGRGGKEALTVPDISVGERLGEPSPCDGLIHFVCSVPGEVM